MAGALSPTATGRLGPAQEVAVGAASAASTAFGSQTYGVRICSTVACRYVVGDGTPAALATSAYLPPNWVEVLTCSPGQKVAVIQETAGGKLSVVELI